MKEYNIHHLVPQSRKGLTNNKNTELMDKRYHDNLHRFFGNDTPTEQIVRVLLLNDKVWSEEFKQQLLEVLYNNIDNYYERKVRSGFDKIERKNVVDLINNYLDD